MFSFRFVRGALGCSLALLSLACSSSDEGAAGMGGSTGGGLYVPPPAPEPVEEPSDGGTFILTDQDPFSTFAADVDTASYDLFRSSLENSGQLPEQSWVRTEEFINYFDYDYPAPAEDAEHPFSISLRATTNFLDNPRALLSVGIQAKEPPPFERKAANLAFLVDVSGSMQDSTKLPLVKRLLTETLGVLDVEDRVSVVTYASGTRVALPSTPVSESAQIVQVINGLSAGGSTNGAGGIQLAYDQVEQNWLEGGINHVILCTDGDFNVGVSSIDGLVDLIETKRETGITFTAVGFGMVPNDAMMEEISNKGNGVYGAIATEEQATEYAHERMLSSLNFVAKDLKIQVEFNPKYVYAYRLLGYENRALLDDDFRDDVIDAGEVGAGHRVTALYELALDPDQLPAGASTGGAAQADLQREIASDDLVLVKVRYKDVDATLEDAAYEVQQSLAHDGLTKPDDDLAWAGAVAYFAEILKQSEYMTPELLPELETVVKAQAGRDDQRDEFIRLFEQARPLVELRARP